MMWLRLSCERQRGRAAIAHLYASVDPEEAQLFRLNMDVSSALRKNKGKGRRWTGKAVADLLLLSPQCDHQEHRLDMRTGD